MSDAYKWDLPGRKRMTEPRAEQYVLHDTIIAELQAELRSQKVTSKTALELYIVLRLNGLNEKADKLFLNFVDNRSVQADLINASHGRDLLWTLQHYSHYAHNYLPRLVGQLMNNKWDINPNHLSDLMTVASKYAAYVIPGTFDRLVAMLQPSLQECIGSVLPAISLILSNYPNPSLLLRQRNHLKQSILGWWVESRYPVDVDEWERTRIAPVSTEELAVITYDRTQRTEVELDLEQALGRDLGGYMVQFL